MNKKKLFIFLILLSGFVLNMLSVQIVGSSFRYLQGELNASIEQISYIMSASLIAEVIIIPFSGWLAKLLSTRVLFLISLSGFVLASIGCGISESFFSMIVFRGLQGLFGGAMLPIMISNIYILFKPKEIPIIISLAATIGVSSIALGPILGGMLTELFNWRWMFLYNIPLGICVLILGYLFIDLKDKDQTLLSKIDFQGILFLAISLIALLIFLEEGERRDWFYSNFIISFFFIFLLFITFFIKRELTTYNPVIDIKIFLNKNFVIGSVILCIFAINLYIPVFLIPIVLSRMHHIDPINIGLIVSTLGLGMMLAGPIAGRVLHLYGVKPVIIIGSFITGLATYMQSFITAEFLYLDFFWSQFLKGVGTQFLFIGSQFIGLSKLNLSLINNASAMFNLTMRLTAAVSIAISSNYFITWNKQFLSQISENHNSDIIILNELAKNNFDNDFLRNLYFLIERESFVMAFNKASYLSVWTVILPILLLFFLNKEQYKNK